MSRQDTEGHPMDSEAKTNSKNALNILESLMKDGDLKSALEKAKQWAANNPVPSGLVAVFALYLVFGYGADLIVTALGFAYPAYQSVKAVESASKEDDTQWLIYWVVFGVFNIVEFFSDILLSWFPLYFLVKLIFLAWCMAPVSWNGSNTLYHKVIKPFVLRHQKNIDKALDEVGEKMDSYAQQAKDAATEAAIKAATESDKKSS
ncbi:receptor expression-enhancing protein 5-like isoform X1 [Acropora muricata]|uniref:receptor expression-enhancing protein 5-like isoform X1 n=1 Tax=Acropora millepora TaxID=45264 RepID=UPI0010FCCC07|nr:receptor expression-enhancing protein 5-like isoform X1 [Acropora millepora]